MSQPPERGDNFKFFYELILTYFSKFCNPKTANRPEDGFQKLHKETAYPVRSPRQKILFLKNFL
jgi:hypothetical protein